MKKEDMKKKECSQQTRFIAIGRDPIYRVRYPQITANAIYRHR